MSSPWAGGSFGERARCLLAPNPGTMTLDGTNTWVLREPGADRCVVVDPGPVEDGHLDLLTETTGEVAVVLLTHHHLDHAESAAELARRKGCPVRAFDPALTLGADPLRDEDVLDVDGLVLRVLATPGHTADSVSLLVPAERALLSGDMVLGRGTTVVAHPGGRLAPYLASIQRLRDLAAAGEVDTVWPGHGPVLDDARGVLEGYLSHRHQRLEQVRGALADLGVTAAEDDDLARRVVERVYADVDESLWVPAQLSVLAQLAYLAEGARAR